MILLRQRVYSVADFEGLRNVAALGNIRTVADSEGKRTVAAFAEEMMPVSKSGNSLVRIRKVVKKAKVI